MEKEEYTPFDALGNPIQIGGKYGYTTDQSGITEVNLGTALKVTPKGLVTIKVTSTTNQYAPTGTRSCIVASTIKTVSVKPIKLFKIN